MAATSDEDEVHPFVYHARREARKFFQRLDSRFDPRVFIVGFPTDPKDTRGAGVAPSDTPFLPEDFRRVPTRAAELEKLDPETGSFWAPDPIHGWTVGHERLQQSKQRGIRCRAFAKAATEAADAAPANAGFIAYCSHPVEVDGNETIVIVQLQRDTFESHYHLSRRMCSDGFREYRLDRSFIDAAATDFAAATAHALTQERSWTSTPNIDDLDRVLLDAASGLMVTPARAGGHQFGARGLFDACTTLSTLTYEGEAGKGGIVFARPGHPHVRADITFSTPVELRSTGAVRKLLQMATGPLALLCDAYFIYGLGRILPSYDQAFEDAFTVRFARQFEWDLLHADNRLMHVRFGRPDSPRPGLPEETFRADLGRVFPHIRGENIERLCGLARTAAEQKHGCMLVVTAEAKSEAERLANQATRVAPFPLTSEIVPLVTAIDGAVLIDQTGNCHAIGVILDGIASDRCAPDRGARYNSAIRYVFGRKDSRGLPDAVALVKSEDGIVTVLPDLRPQIRRSDIAEAMGQLRTLAERPSLRARDLAAVMRRLEDSEFYLTRAECDEAIRLHEAARERLTDDDWYSVRSQPLTPDPDMNETYYMPD